MAFSPEDVCNQALRAIGVRHRISYIYEGSAQARAALAVYGTTRDGVLMAQDWPFARAAGVTLTLLKGPPPPGGYSFVQPWTNAYPPPPWLYEYAYPADCLLLLSLRERPAGLILPDLDPQPVTWRVDNDVVGGTSQKVIMSSAMNAIATYRRRVTNPALWNSDFVDVMVEALARKLSAAFGQDPKREENAEQLATAMNEAAMRRRG